MSEFAHSVAFRRLLVCIAAALPIGSAAADIANAPEAAFQLNSDKNHEYRLSPTTSPFRLALSAPPAPVAAPAVPANDVAQFADRPYAALIETAARAVALDTALVHAVISVESAYDPSARSPKGAIGLMQIMPETGRRYGVHPALLTSPADNLKAGTRYLKDLFLIFDNRIELVLAAYNAGEKSVQRYGMTIPPYRETQQYVPAVLTRYHQWRGPVPLSTFMVATPSRIEYLQGTLLEPALLGASRRP